MLNEMEDMEAVDETADNGNAAGVGVSQDVVTNGRQGMDKGKEPMPVPKQAGVQFGLKVNVSHANLGDGLKVCGKWRMQRLSNSV